MQRSVIKEQVYAFCTASYLNGILATDEHVVFAQFQDKIPHVFQNSFVQLGFYEVLRQGQKIKNQPVLQQERRARVLR